MLLRNTATSADLQEDKKQKSVGCIAELQIEPNWSQAVLEINGEETESKVETLGSDCGK